MRLDFNWTTIAVALLNLLVGGALVAFVRSRPALRKIDGEREANLLSERAKDMEEMRRRIDRLEAEARKSDETHAAEKEGLLKQFDAVVSLYRHRTNNIDASFNALLLLLKKGVSVTEAVEAVEKMRAEQLKREAVEAATFRAAGITLPFEGGGK